MTPEEQQAADMAIILEGKIKERLQEIVPPMLQEMAVPLVAELIRRQKESMMLEIATHLGKILQSTQKENRKPLWELDPLDNEFEDIKEFRDAVQEQSRPKV